MTTNDFLLMVALMRKYEVITIKIDEVVTRRPNIMRKNGLEQSVISEWTYLCQVTCFWLHFYIVPQTKMTG